MRRKSDLPSKLCAACGRPFVWRKKWARDWSSVRYCSRPWRRKWAKAASAPARVTANQKGFSSPKWSGKRVATISSTSRVIASGSKRSGPGRARAPGAGLRLSRSKFQRPPAGWSPSINSPVLRRISRQKCSIRSPRRFSAQEAKPWRSARKRSSGSSVTDGHCAISRIRRHSPGSVTRTCVAPCRVNARMTSPCRLPELAGSSNVT
ncbi:DUF2256 domain-containing protein [Gluconobacter sp. AC10]|uniref:DUF2256 domain-containing protein n=1 Tax=Gluconobacter aidae TaxID=2662454 RepID=A0A7X1STC6_9PROT|nr:DUF2256 domain-containing protein [Gluconobacter aidae]